MSRRKQGKPQQRRHLDSVEEEHYDLIICGSCQKNFPLQDIVKFINHKTQRCNKENVNLLDGCASKKRDDDNNDNSDNSDNSEKYSVITSRTSISAPISRKEGAESQPLLLHPSDPMKERTLLTDNNNTTDGSVSCEAVNGGDCYRDKLNSGCLSNSDPLEASPSPIHMPKHVDAEANTVNSEPSCFVCLTCKSNFGSAWCLLQHVQDAHGMKIYLSPTSDDSTDEEMRDAGSPGTPPPPLRVPSIERRFSPPPSSPSDLRLAAIPRSPNSSSLENKHTLLSSQRHAMPDMRPSSPQRSTPPPKAHLNPTVSMPLAIGIPMASNTPISLSNVLQPHGPRISDSRTPTPSSNPTGTPPFTTSYNVFRLPPAIPSDRQPLTSVNPFSRPPIGQEMGMGDPFQRMNMGMVGYEHNHPGQYPMPFDRSRIPLGVGLEDFYSQRLRQLAGTTSPTSPSSKKLTPPVPQQTQFSPAVSPFSLPPSSAPSTPEIAHRVGTPGSLPPLPSEHESMSHKLKSCEFCGKSFRFQSNLVVHRRCHTGEKPFQCHLCPHACTQASKLKRHMKTHFTDNSTNLDDSGLDGTDNLSDVSIESEGSPDSSRIYGNEDNISNLDDGDDELDEEMEDAEREEYERDAEERMHSRDIKPETDCIDCQRQADSEENRSVHSPLSPDCEVGEIKPFMSPLQCRIDSNSNSELDEKCIKVKSEPEMSLLREVMDNTGLGAIQQYSDAFQQALAENSQSSSSKEDTTSPKSGSKINHTPSPKQVPKNGPGNDERHYDAKHISSSRGTTVIPYMEPPSKQLKREPPDTIQSLEAMYAAGVWYPPALPPREFIMGHPPLMAIDAAAVAHHHNSLNHNMFANKPQPNSALKMSQVGMVLQPPPPPLSVVSNSLGVITTPNGGLGGPIHCNSNSRTLNAHVCSPHHHGISHMHHHKKESRRNDTCEYCGKIFKNCSNLTVHRRSHTGEKPYKCDLCSYACAQSSKLTRHMRTHGRLGKDVYRCKFCSMPFSVASTLEKHMRKCVETHQAHGHGRQLLALSSSDMEADTHQGHGHQLLALTSSDVESSNSRDESRM